MSKDVDVSRISEQIRKGGIKEGQKVSLIKGYGGRTEGVIECLDHPHSIRLCYGTDKWSEPCYAGFRILPFAVGDKVTVEGERAGTIVKFDEDDPILPFNILLESGETTWATVGQLSKVTEEEETIEKPFVEMLQDVVDGKFPKGTVIEADGRKFTVEKVWSTGKYGLNNHDGGLIKATVYASTLNSTAKVVKLGAVELTTEEAEKELSRLKNAKVIIN